MSSNDTGFAAWRVCPHGVRPHYKLSILSSPPTFRSFLATSNLITRWIKEQGLISICDLICLMENLIKLNRCVGELGRGKLAMGQNQQLPNEHDWHGVSRGLWSCNPLHALLCNTLSCTQQIVLVNYLFRRPSIPSDFLKRIVTLNFCVTYEKFNVCCFRIL